MHFSTTDATDSADTPSPGERLRYLPQRLLPQRPITRIAHRLTRIRTAWFKNLLIRGFIAAFRVDMTEAMEPDPRAYPDFNHFFTRPLKADARPLAAEAKNLCCPVDGAVSQAGTLVGDDILQAKGHDFSLIQLLGGDSELALPFRNGRFVTLYLSPRDYHRIHMPLQGRLLEMVHIPGELFSVSPLTTRMVPGLFARNERVAAIFETTAGPMAMVLVGAINVASIETVWAGAVTPPLGYEIRRWRYPETGAEAIHLAKGAEMGRFNMGSTVILIFGQDAIVWDPCITPEASVRMGQKLGAIA
jgi:phosphatidylserine decarboxylase